MKAQIIFWKLPDTQMHDRVMTLGIVKITILEHGNSIKSLLMFKIYPIYAEFQYS